MIMQIGEGISGAIFSKDRLYRYALWRIWDRKLKPLLWVGLNPCWANETKDDTSTSRMAYRAKTLGYGSLYIGNLFAVVAPYPEQLVYGNDAIGQENDKYLVELKKVAGAVVVGWGNHGRSVGRDKSVLDILGKPVYCLAVTKSGAPTHPLYVPWSAELKEYLPEPKFS